MQSLRPQLIKDLAVAHVALENRRGELRQTTSLIADGQDVPVAPSKILEAIAYHKGEVDMLERVLRLVEEEERFCVICEGKSDFKLSDEGYCGPCFDAAEEADQEHNKSIVGAN